MNKYKYLFKNIGLLTLSSFATKLLSFFLVPLYTSVLSTSEYGEYDFVSSTVGILVPLLTVNIYEAVLRFSMGKEAPPKDVFSVGCKFCSIGNFIVGLILIINHIIGISAVIDKFSIYFFLIFFVNSVSGIVNSMARGLDKISAISVAGVISSATTIALNIVLLCAFKCGIDGYFIANIAGLLVQIIYLLIAIKGWRYFSLSRRARNTEKAMVKYSIPTIANAIAWWVNGLADRYIIIFFCGIAANGIYSVASKIPSILNIFQNIFSQAFMLSAVKEFDAEDNDGFFSRTFETYNFLLVIICSLIIISDKILAKYLYSNDFYEAWRYVPFLTISIIFGSLSGYAGSIFAALKRSDYFAKCSGAGAIVNICLNLILIPAYGPLGASIATAFSYWIVYLVSMIYLKKGVNMKAQLLCDNFAYVILLLQSFVLLAPIKSVVLEYGIQFLFVIVLVALYRSRITMLINNVRSVLGRNDI